MNKSDDKTLSFLEDRRRELESDRETIDQKIKALDGALAALTSDKSARKAKEPGAAPAPRKRRKMKPGRKIDKKANEKTIAFAKERKRPFGADAVAARFHITEAAAIQRLLTLAGQGALVRVARGKYIDKDRAPVNGAEAVVS